MFRTGFSNITTVSKIMLVICVLFAMSACGSNKTVVTKDDSADYQSARALPPLRKVGTPSSNTKVDTSAAQQQLPAAPEQTPEVSAPSLVPSQVNEDALADTEPFANNEPSANNEPPANNDPATEFEDVALEPNVNKAKKRDLKKQASATSAKVVDKGKGARLVLNQPFESAWFYVSDNLKGSDITVHNRNEVAGRFSIGCADMNEQTVESKTGGWSIFKKKGEELEYCALQLIGKRKSTEVSVLNRSGLEVDADAAKVVFARLLNN